MKRRPSEFALLARGVEALRHQARHLASAEAAAYAQPLDATLTALAACAWGWVLMS